MAQESVHEPPQPAAPIGPHDPFAALRLRDFRRFLAGNMLSLLGLQMQTFAVSWEIYERTHSNLALAWVGLVQVLPVIGLFLPAGHLVDRVDRRAILLTGLVVVAICSHGLAQTSAGAGDVGWMYVYLFLVGVARSFLQPARASFLPQIVPRAQFSNAVTWHSSGFQVATVTGPALAGLVIAVVHSASQVYLVTAALVLANALFLATIPRRQTAAPVEAVSLRSLVAGVTFLWQTPVMLGAIALDMFAVLLGGATALLPVYAKDILHVGPADLGWMRAAPGLGAIVMSVWLAWRPPFERAGRSLLWAVAGFGGATIVFGLSRSFELSLGMLFVLGALDMISVVIRHTLVQLLTPDAMRGRVSAVNGMFIGVSNELGEFESGVVAHAFDRPDDRGFGPTVSVVAGGIGTLLVVAAVALCRPEVRRFGRLDGSVEPGDLK